MTERLSNERLGCLDGGCVFAPLRDNSGQHTNGGCRCLKELPHKLRRDLRALVDELRERRDAHAQLVKRLRDELKRIRARPDYTAVYGDEALSWVLEDVLDVADFEPEDA